MSLDLYTLATVLNVHDLYYQSVNSGQVNMALFTVYVG